MQGSQSTALHAQTTASPVSTQHDLSRVSRCLLIDIYVRVYIYVRMYKTVSLLTANTVGHSHHNKFSCVCVL